MSSTQTLPAEAPLPAGEVVSPASAARRTGLADTAAAMAALCGSREVPFRHDSPGVPARVPLTPFLGSPTDLELPTVTILETGRL